MHRIPEPFAPADEPRASWIVRAGEYLYEQEVCSSDRDQRCVLPASTADQTVSVVVTVFLHPAGGAETRYHGAYLVGFMPGPTGRGSERKVDLAIEAGGKARAVSVASRVVDTPGEYPFDVALFADVAGRADPHQFLETITVRVVPPTGDVSTTEKPAVADGVTDETFAADRAKRYKARDEWTFRPSPGGCGSVVTCMGTDGRRAK
jgi:hypothetical protein